MESSQAHWDQLKLTCVNLSFLIYKMEIVSSSVVVKST